MKYKVTSLERWGLRSSVDFQPACIEIVRNAGFNGVFFNGGSGIGPDMISPEALVVTRAIPDLMPLTARSHSALAVQRVQALEKGGLKPWLCVWGVPGPDRSQDSHFADSNRLFDRRTKLEMSACLERHPDLFGHRKPARLSWRGNRPLCVSHPQVQEFYDELFQELPRRYPLEGIFFFPGDSDAELCDKTCPRCAATGLDESGRLVLHANRIYKAAQKGRPGLPFYFAVWNQDHAGGREVIGRFLENLDPGIGICMSLSDNFEQERRCGTVKFNQPWSLMPEVGALFRETAAQCEAENRPIMVFAEIAQSEVWDPVCHNFPLPAKILQFLRNASAIPQVNALHDFWGHRSPTDPHANFAASAVFWENPEAPYEEQLSLAADRHYDLGGNQELLGQALATWDIVDKTVEGWALTSWAQRFSFAIGRDGARGRLYYALIPAFLKTMPKSWEMTQILRHGQLSAAVFAQAQEEDRERFLAAGDTLEALSGKLSSAGLSAGAASALREAETLRLAGELVASIGRAVCAIDLCQKEEWETLREIVLAEIDGRERQLVISGRIGYGGGVNAMLVEEDLQNMRLFLSHPAYPDVPADQFNFTFSPFTG